jgi:hypothetical protein
MTLIHERFFELKVNIGIRHKKIQGAFYSFKTLSLVDCLVELVISAYPFLVLSVNHGQASCHCFGIPGDCCHGSSPMKAKNQGFLEKRLFSLFNYTTVLPVTQISVLLACGVLENGN